MKSKRVRNSLLTVITSLFVLVASACSGGAGNTPANSGSASADSQPNIKTDAKPTTLTVWWFPLWNGSDGKPDGWVKEKAKEFMAKNPTVKDIKVEMLTWQNGVQKLDTAVAAGSPPDLAYIDLAWLPKYINQGAALPVTPYLQKDELSDYYKSTTDYATYNNQLYAFPILIAPRVMYANKTLLQEMGLADKLPLTGDRSWTIDQFKEIASKFPYKKDGKTIHAAEISTNQGAWGHFMWFWNFGADLYDQQETKFTLNSPQGVQALDFMTGMVKSGAFSLVSGGAKESNFWAGDLAFTFDLAYTQDKVQELLKKSIPDGKPLPEIVSMQFPKGPDVRSAKTYAGIGGIPVFKQKNEDQNHLKMAMEFAKFLTTPENDKAVKDIGTFPTRISSGDVFNGDINAQVARSMMQEGRDLGRGDAANKIYMNLINQELDAAFSGKKAPQQTLDDLAKKANDILGGK